MTDLNPGDKENRGKFLSHFGGRLYCPNALDSLRSCCPAAPKAATNDGRLPGLFFFARFAFAKIQRILKSGGACTKRSLTIRSMVKSDNPARDGLISPPPSERNGRDPAWMIDPVACSSTSVIHIVNAARSRPLLSSHPSRLLASTRAKCWAGHRESIVRGTSKAGSAELREQSQRRHWCRSSEPTGTAQADRTNPFAPAALIERTQSAPRR